MPRNRLRRRRSRLHPSGEFLHRSIHPERSILSRAEERLPAAPHRRACCVLNLLFPIHFARRVSRHAGTQCLRAIFNCASFRWEWWQIPTKARSCSTSPLGGAGAALSLSSQPTRVLYRRRELARGRRSQHMRCARKISRRMTILQLALNRANPGVQSDGVILHCIVITSPWPVDEGPPCVGWGKRREGTGDRPSSVVCFHV